MKTEYRIVTGYGIYDRDRFLQFKRIKKVKLFFKEREKITWCFIPGEVKAKVCSILSKNECTGTPSCEGDQKWYIHADHYNENDLICFTNDYPDIDKYFEYLKKYIAESNEREVKIKKKLSKTIYL